MTFHHAHDACTTCARPAGCPECGQAWPRGVPGYIDTEGNWRDGKRPTGAAKPSPGEKALTAAVAAEDQARAKWEAAEVARRAAESEARSAQPFFSNGMPVHPHNPEADRRLRELAEAAELAREQLTQASKAVLKARQEAATRAHQA